MAADGEKQMAVDILARHGITNTWCSHPTADIPAHSSSNRRKAGDRFFETEVTLAYRLGDGEEVQVFARTKGGGGGGRFPDAGCGLLSPAPRFGCEARVTGGSVQHWDVIFRVFPFSAGAGHQG